MIPVKNIYYMLSYAFRLLQENGYQKVGTEDFDNTAELFAAILIQGITLAVKRGLGREYVEETDATTQPRGKIDLTETVRSRSIIKKQLVCTYDEFSVNNRMNQIVKSTGLLLLRSGLSIQRRQKLRHLLMYFAEVDEIELRRVDWHFRYSRNNQNYRLLISVCRLLCHGLLQTQEHGSLKLMDFQDSQEMHALYERFLLAYYRRTFPALQANASYIPWQLDDDVDTFLPAMKTDITLSDGHKTLIIDAKYYASNILQSQFEKKSIRSGHLYQIFSYVKNKAATMKENPQNVSGLLLYAGTDEEITPNQTYSMSGNHIGVETLDLNQDFSEIKAHLDRIVMDNFEIERTGM